MGAMFPQGYDSWPGVPVEAYVSRSAGVHRARNSLHGTESQEAQQDGGIGAQGSQVRPVSHRFFMLEAVLQGLRWLCTGWVCVLPACRWL